MFRLNGAYFYEGGVKLQAVRGIATGTKLSDTLLRITDAANWIKATLSDVFHLKTSYAAGQELLRKLDDFRLKVEDDIRAESQGLVGWEIFNLHLSVYTFETLLKAELSVSDFYFVTPKGCFDTTQLISSGHSLFPADLISKVPEAGPDCIGAGRCIAFDLPTAAAFHLHRLNEVVLRAYFNAVAPGVKHPESRTIRAYIDAMKNQGLNNKKVQSALASLSSLHRNPVMHPEQSLDNLDEAIALWGSVNACVVHMLKEIPPPPLELLPPPNDQ
jgi:hypothetical protein